MSHGMICSHWWLLLAIWNHLKTKLSTAGCLTTSVWVHLYSMAGIQKKLVKITLTHNCAVMLLAQLIMWLAHDFWLHIILCKQQLFNFFLSVTCTAGKQAWNAVPSHLPFYSVAGMVELFFLLSFTYILDYNSTSFYCTPLIQVHVHSWAD